MSANPSRPRFLYGGGIAALVLLALLVLLLNLRHRARVRREAARREAILAAGPQVLVAPVRRAPAERQLSLQGEARAFTSVTLYAKVSGYVREMRADKGDRAAKDQVLAVLESPELESQYQAALADARNKEAIARRARALVGPGVVSIQDADVARTNAEVAEARVQELRTQRAYEIIRAPFAGTVTARFVDPGALVQNAANAQTGALPVVSVAQLDRLRVYIYMAQADAPFVRAGDAVEITVPERPARSYPASVARVSGELDPRTRMMLVEADMDNPDGEIVPGSFVQATLRLRSPAYLEVPSEAVVPRGDQVTVPVVGPDNRVHFRPVSVASDDGRTVRLLAGLKEGERVALNLGERVHDGSKVQPIAQTAAPTAGQPRR